MCIGYLELNQLKISLDMNGLIFLLFNILDHICTTSFVFANPFGKYFQSLLVNSQRYMNKIARSNFKI
jgi:hypothetical protein